MIEAGGIPLFGPGTRVEVSVDELMLVCRTTRMQGRTLHLAAPSGSASLANLFTPGRTVQLTLYRASACWEAMARVREWLWTQPSTLVVGPVFDWKEKPRRAALRTERALDACLVLEDGVCLCGRTHDVSPSGVSLMVPGAPGLNVGGRARMTVRLTEEVWCEDIPLRIARLESWISARGRSALVGAAVEGDDPRARARWESCLLEWMGGGDKGQEQAA